MVKYEPYKPMNFAEAAEELNERITSAEMIAVVLTALGIAMIILNYWVA